MLRNNLTIENYFKKEILDREKKLLFCLENNHNNPQDYYDFMTNPNCTHVLPMHTITQQLTATLKDFFCPENFDFKDYIFIQRSETHYDGNWKTFLEVHLDNYHVDPFHPGLSSFVNCEDIKWNFGNGYCSHIVPLHELFSKSGSQRYRDWHMLSHKLTHKGYINFGVTWLTIYPNIIIEWYPYTLMLSKIWPESVTKYVNTCEFYCLKDAIHLFPQLPEIAINAYTETADEDEIIIRRIEQGRKALFGQKTNEFGPYQNKLEKGIEHFHEYINKKLFD